MAIITPPITTDQRAPMNLSAIIPPRIGVAYTSPAYHAKRCDASPCFQNR